MPCLGVMSDLGFQMTYIKQKVNVPKLTHFLNFTELMCLLISPITQVILYCFRFDNWFLFELCLWLASKWTFPGCSVSDRPSFWVS